MHQNSIRICLKACVLSKRIIKIQVEPKTTFVTDTISPYKTKLN